MKTALVFGATGLVGESLINQLLSAADYSSIYAIARSPLSVKHEKLKVMLSELGNLSNVELTDKIDDVFCCLGTTIKKAGTREAFEKVDYTFVLNAAKFGLKREAKAFLVVSAIGADAKSKFAYNRVKGKMEMDVIELAYPSTHIFRPSLLVGNRKEYRFGEKVGEFFLTLFQPIMIGNWRKYRKVHVDNVAGAMIRAAKENPIGVFIYESDSL
jgi:uncharacterized protein YbjT (DUF2867 family)